MRRPLPIRGLKAAAVSCCWAWWCTLLLSGGGRSRSAQGAAAWSAPPRPPPSPRAGASGTRRAAAPRGGDPRRQPQSISSGLLPGSRPVAGRSRRRHRPHDGALRQSPSPELTNEEISRYSRHLVLPRVGVRGQRRLKGSAVLVVGAGGLGSPVLLYLAAAGVGRIGIVDADVVDESNLQRQVVHGTSTVGLSKCRSARQRLRDVNPHVRVRSYEEEFTAGSARRIVEGGFEPGAPYRVVVDGSDNFPTKYLINDVCALAGLPWVYSAILGFEGQLSVFNCPPGVGPDYRDLLPVPPPPGDVPSCAEGGVLGVLPGTLGCLQAVECLKLLLGESAEDDEGLCAGRVLVFDALKMKFSEVGLARTPGREPVSDLIDYQGFCGGPSSSASSSASPAPPATSAAPAAEAGPPALPTGTRINGAIEFAARPSTPRRTMDESADAPDDAAGAAPSPSADSSAPRFHSISPGRCFERLRSGWSPWVVDVRLGAEHDIVALPFTDRVVPHREVSPRDVPKGGDVLVYCKGGVRGKKACEALAAQGVDPARLYNLRGGILQWQREVDPSMPRY